MASMAEVFNRFADDYRKHRILSFEQQKLIRDICECRTHILGGHVTACSSCGHIKVYYNSCGNRHCPQCQGVNKEKWILERAYDLLNVKYFHVVFTLPSELRSICYQNQRLIYNILFGCAWQTLDDFSKDPRQRLMARMGMIAVLHTWTQTLLYHPHIHCIIPAGGLDDGGNWKSSKSSGDFLFYDGAVAKAFRGKFLEQLVTLYKTKKLTLEGKISHLKQYHNFWKLKKKLYETNWVVHTEDPFKNPDSVIEYLARYTHKIAISNYRIKAIDDDWITFTYLDRANNNKKETMLLSPQKFINRFLLHVLPKSFCKIRHYGFLSTRVKQQCLPLIRLTLNMKEQEAKPKLTVKDVLRIIIGIDPDLCPECRQGIMICIQELPRLRGSPNFSLCS
jgi:hypothetical protein